VQTIEVRKELTNEEGSGRGAKENQEYAILTATIAKETFGLNPSEHSNLKVPTTKGPLSINVFFCLKLSKKDVYTEGSLCGLNSFYDAYYALTLCPINPK
jgi:hypothetical protein